MRLYNRAKFFQRGQLATEDVLSYATERRPQSIRFGFAANEKELIRHRLLAECRVERIRERLLLEADNPTLLNALKIAQSVERSVLESGLFGPDNKQFAIAKVSQLRARPNN